MGLLRFLLAIAVILTHCGKLFGFEFVGGRIAVETFFMISGFYITLILNEKYIEKNNSYSLFITNRFLRLYPFYFFTLLVTFICACYLPNYTAKSYMGNLGSWTENREILSFTTYAYLTFANLFIFLQDLVYYLGLNLKSGFLFLTSNFLATKPPQVYTFMLIPQAWSLSLELLFYLLAPFIVRRRIFIIVFLLIASLASKSYFLNHGFNTDPWTYRFFPFELMFFLLGTLAYYMYRKIKKIAIPKAVFLLMLIFVSLFTIFFSFISVTLYTYRIYIATVFILMPFLFQYTKNIKADRFAGELSYPIYITHILVFNVAKALGFANHLAEITIVGSVLLSVLLVKLIGDPIERIRQRRVTDQTGVNKARNALSVKL